MTNEPVNPHLDIAPGVARALESGQPVVALESTIISHGMPYPQNIETALAVEDAVREAGATPATIAIQHGRLKVGLGVDEIGARDNFFDLIVQEHRHMVFAFCYALLRDAELAEEVTQEVFVPLATPAP